MEGPGESSGSVAQAGLQLGSTCRVTRPHRCPLCLVLSLYILGKHACPQHCFRSVIESSWVGTGGGEFEPRLDSMTVSYEVTCSSVSTVTTTSRNQVRQQQRTAERRRLSSGRLMFCLVPPPPAPSPTFITTEDQGH